MPGHMRYWPGKGADLNPLDYGVWGTLQERVWADKCATYLDLKTSVLKHVAEFSDAEISACVLSFPGRAKLCKEAEGGYIAHKLGAANRRQETKKTNL